VRFLRHKAASSLPGVTGPVRIDRRTKNLTKRLRPGDVAVIDHIDLDRVSAEALVGCGVAAVVNLSPSISGRYPNLGPEILVAAGIPLLDGVGVPDITTELEGRQVLIVVRGYHYKDDIVTLRPYIREYRPVLIGVDGGADALLEAGYKPHLIVGDMDSVSDMALNCGAELVVHAYRDGTAPGLARLQALGLEPVVFPATGTSEDVAMLLSDDKGASLIVAVGTHATLVEFLDKGREGMASTFLTRLRLGSKLVDAKGVSMLYRSRIATWQVSFLLGAGLLTLAAAMAATPLGRSFYDIVGSRWHDFTFWLHGIF
jgi:uncharacterized membrane-anchored protein